MTSPALQVLGRFVLRDAAAQAVDVSGEKNRALLAILALSPEQSLSRRQIAGLLWSDRGDEQSRSSLRQALATLRKDLAALVPCPLLIDETAVRLDANLLKIDAVTLMQAAKTDDAAVLREAIVLYGGELLAGIAIHDTAFEEWLGAERGRVRESAIAIAERLWQRETPGRRVEIAKRLVGLEPLKESSHRALMLAYAEAGENALALQHYSDCRDLLRKELAISPGAEIERLRQQILAGSRVATRSHNSEADVDNGSQSTTRLDDKPSIAVLPFANMSGDPQQDYFADGVVEEITMGLSRLNWLFVIDRNSSFSYKGRAIDVKSIGRELGVRYVLEGSLRRSGNMVRIASQLVDTSNGLTLWADRFDGEVESIFDLQDQVTSRTVGAIAPKLEKVEIERAKRKATGSLDAYDCYLRGIAALHKWEKEANGEALMHFYRAISLDDGYASAYGMAARTYAQRRSNGWVDNRAQDVAETVRLARRAIDLGSDDPVALCMAGFALADVADELEDGIALIDRSLELSPNYAVAWLFSGWVKISLGQPDDAIACVERAMRLSPQDSHMFTMHAAKASAHLIAGRYAQAFTCAEAALRAKPDNLINTCVGAASAALAGKTEEARILMQRVREAAPHLRLENLRDINSYLRPRDFERWAEGMRLAGLPQ